MSVSFFFSCWVTNMKLRIISVIIGFSLSGSQYFFIGIVYYVNMQLLNVNSNQSYIEINKQHWTKALDIADRCGFRETVIRTIGMSFRVSCHEMDRYTQIEKKEEKVCMNVASCSRFHSKKRTCTSKWNDEISYSSFDVHVHDKGFWNPLLNELLNCSLLPTEMLVMTTMITK